jgi:hypothetical protein
MHKLTWVLSGIAVAVTGSSSPFVETETSKPNRR